MRRGFTILELSCVLAVIAIISALCIPAYDVLVRRAKADEARTVIHAIAHAQLRHYRDHGGYLACDPQVDPAAAAGSFPNQAACWKQLGITLDGDVRYRYAVALTDDSFEVTATGDLNRDGEFSRFTLSGHDLQLTIQDELE